MKKMCIVCGKAVKDAMYATCQGITVALCRLHEGGVRHELPGLRVGELHN